MNKKIKQILLSYSIVVCIFTLLFTATAFAQQQMIQQHHHIQTQQQNNQLNNEIHNHTDWAVLENNTNEIKSSGKYYLNKEYAGTITITGNNTEVTLCLNGNTITNNEQSAAICVTDGAVLTLCDCQKSGRITGGKKSGVFVENSTFIMTGGTISQNTAEYGGGVSVYHGKFYISGGEIKQNQSAQCGGGVYMNDSAFYMSGGSISENAAVYKGGGVYTDSNVEMTGGIIGGENDINKNTAQCGGGVYITSENDLLTEKSRDITFTMTNASIRNNQAQKGGGVYIDGYYSKGSSTALFTMKQNSSITENKAVYGSEQIESDGNGGGVYISVSCSADNSAIPYGEERKHASYFNMEYGEICNNTAQNNGGGIYTKDNDTFYEHINGCGIEWGGDVIVYIKNGKISNNTSENDGGGIYTKGHTVGTTFFTECGEISNNIANRGGGIYMEHTSFNMEGETAVVGNTANSTEFAGAGMYLEDASFSMSQGKISENKSINGNAGGIYINNCSIFIMDNGTISKNTANDGAGMYAACGSTFIMRNGMIDENVAQHYGGGVFVNEATFRMENGAVTNNIANDTFYGMGGSGGIYVNETGVFRMTAGEISQNTTDNGVGGGIFVLGTFDVSGNAAITKNTKINSNN